MILETYCHACKRGMPAFMWGFHKWWHGCPGKTPAQHDRENGLIVGVPIADWKKLWPGPLSPRCGQPECYGGVVVNGMETRDCPTCRLWKHSFEERLARFKSLQGSVR